jgi:hypothetical protein
MVRIMKPPREAVIDFGGRLHAREILSSVDGDDEALIRGWAAARLRSIQVRDGWLHLVRSERIPIDLVLIERTVRQVFDDSNGIRPAQKRYLAFLRQRFVGTAKLLQVNERGRREKGKREAESMFELARLALEQRPELTRRELIETLMRQREGRDAVFTSGKRRSTRDPIYRAAYKRVDRRLRRGFTLAGEPREIRHLI